MLLPILLHHHHHLLHHHPYHHNRLHQSCIRFLPVPVPLRPLGVSTRILDARTVLVTWEGLLVTRARGILHGYRIAWWECPVGVWWAPSSSAEVTRPHTALSATLQGLRPTTRYCAVIRGFNAKGDGYGKQILFETQGQGENYRHN